LHKREKNVKTTRITNADKAEGEKISLTGWGKKGKPEKKAGTSKTEVLSLIEKRRTWAEKGKVGRGFFEKIAWGKKGEKLKKKRRKMLFPTDHH